MIISAQYHSKNTWYILVLHYRQEAVCKFTLVR